MPHSISASCALECGACETLNQGDRRFCRDCGASLVRGCERCLFVNGVCDRFCGGCGIALPDTRVADAVPQVVETETSTPVPMFAAPKAPAPSSGQDETKARRVAALKARIDSVMPPGPPKPRTVPPLPPPGAKKAAAAQTPPPPPVTSESQARLNPAANANPASSPVGERRNQLASRLARLNEEAVRTRPMPTVGVNGPNNSEEDDDLAQEQIDALFS